MPRGAPIDRLVLSTQIESGEIPLKSLHPLGQAALALVTGDRMPTYATVVADLNVPGFTRFLLASYIEVLRSHAPSSDIIEKKGKSLEEANERFMAKRLLEQVNLDGSLKNPNIVNNKNILLLKVARADTTNHEMFRKPSPSPELVTCGSHGYMCQTARDLGIIHQELTHLHAIMMYDLESAITQPRDLFFLKHIQSLPITQSRSEKEKYALGLWTDDYRERLQPLVQHRDILLRKSQRDALDEALIRAINLQIQKLSVISTQYLNRTLDVSSTPGHVLLYLDALRTVAIRKIGKRVGKSVDDSVRLTQLAMDIADIHTSTDLIKLIRSKQLPDAWKAEVYTELLPLFVELYRDSGVFSSTDIALLSQLADPSKHSMVTMRNNGVNGFAGRAVGILKYAILYGTTRPVKFWPQKKD